MGRAVARVVHREHGDDAARARRRGEVDPADPLGGILALLPATIFALLTAVGPAGASVFL